MDLALFRAINNFAGRWQVVDQTAIFFATYAGVIVVAVLAYLWLFPRKPYFRRMVLTAYLAAGVSRGIIVPLIRFFYERARPVPVDAVHRLVVNTEWAFPSGHASFFFALATGVYLYHKKGGITCFVVAALMGIARIFIGVHWPTDILGGAVLGILTGIFVYRIVRTRDFGILSRPVSAKTTL